MAVPALARTAAAASIIVRRLAKEETSKVEEKVTHIEPLGASGAPPVVATKLSRFLLLILGVYALVFGFSGLFGGFFDLAWSGSATLVTAAILIGVAVAADLRVGRLGAIALCGLGGIVLWTAVSGIWSESIDRAWAEVNRYGLYLVALLTVLVAAGSQRRARILIRLIGASTAGIGAYVLVLLVLGEGEQLFLRFRLTDPMGYVNGQAAYFLLGFWALFGVTEGDGAPARRALALAGAVMLAELAVLTQSRGAAFGFAVAAGVLLAVVPGRLQRAWLLILAIGAVGLALPWLLDVYEQEAQSVGPFPTGGVQTAAGVAICASSALAGALWWLFQHRGRADSRVPWRRVAYVGLAVAVAGALAAAAIRFGDPTDEVRAAYDDFVSLQLDEERSQRFTSGEGYRYDYWRIAANAFADSPLVGLGAGDYATRYVRERTNPDYITQPHSLALQLLAELGVPGLLGLLAFSGAVLWAGAQPRSRWGHGDKDLRVAGLGMFVMWLAHTNVDWLHNLPGVTCLALAGAAVLLIRATPVVSAAPVGAGGSAPAVVAMAAALLVAVSAGVQWAADLYQRKAQARIQSNPVAAIENANRSIALNPERIDTYVVKSAAYASVGNLSLARRVLLTAAGKEPGNYVPWALLGDLSVRAGAFEQAGREYQRASTLNPFDRALAQLARTPEMAGRDGE